MADITFNPSGYKPSGAAIRKSGVAGEAFVAGVLLYRSAADGKYYKADATSATKAAVAGMSESGGYIDQPFILVTSDPLVTNSASPFTAGQIYILSATATSGKFAPISDLSAGMYAAPVLIALSATTAMFDILTNTTAY